MNTSIASGYGIKTTSPAMLGQAQKQAKDLEGVFMNMLTKEMFATVHSEESGFGGGFAEETWRGMQAEQLSGQMAEAGGIGLADAILGDLIAIQEANQNAQGSLQLITAAERIAALDDLPAHELVGKVEALLIALAAVMNEETTLLRTGHFREAGTLTADKTRLAQDYVTFSRSVQRQLFRLRKEAPDDLARLRSGHERLATQMAENLRVIATARDVTESLLTDVAETVGAQGRTKTYGATGEVRGKATAAPARGIAVNRAL